MSIKDKVIELFKKEDLRRNDEPFPTCFMYGFTSPDRFWFTMVGYETAPLQTLEEKLIKLGCGYDYDHKDKFCNRFDKHVGRTFVNFKLFRSKRKGAIKEDKT